MSIDRKQACRAFAAHFGGDPHVAVRAPGRVNIIGEHTDYNEGFVLPMALERETVILARKRDDGALHAHAANLGRSARVAPGAWQRNADEPWIDYVVGVARELEAAGHPIVGADLMIQGDVPIASGLSSSASLEMAALTLFETLGGFLVAGAEAPKLGKRVENDFLGLSSGIMDQFVVRMARAGHALFLDCRTYDYELVPVTFPDAVFVVAHTGVTRGLSASEYNKRVAECAAAVQAMSAALGKNGGHLRDFSLDDLRCCEQALPDVPFRRARHVITEDDRTRRACEAMKAGDAAALGLLMNGSDESLRVDYEVTCEELDAMTAIARGLPGCCGARMTGAGFGGCTVNLVEAAAVEAFSQRLLAEYKDRTGLRGEVIASSPGDGAGVLALPEMR